MRLDRPSTLGRALRGHRAPTRLAAVVGATALALTAVTGTSASGAEEPVAGSRPKPDVVVVTKTGTVSVSGATGVAGPDDLSSRAQEIQKRKRLGTDPLRREAGVGDPVDPAPTTSPAARAAAPSVPPVTLGFEGLNHRDSRLAQDGNSFSGEPADQGICAGNGYILETVNSALRVYSAKDGAPVSPVLSLNELYGFPPAIDRAALAAGTPPFFGPFTFDVQCHFDPAVNRWFHLAVDLDQDPVTGDFTGKNYLDLAVSTSGDPTGTWDIYRIPAMNDGTEGTPDHECDGGPCFGDFPHLGVDAHGVYITTNEFPLFADGFTGAQVYAMSKSALVRGRASVNAYLFNTGARPWQVREGEPGFTVWPAVSAGRTFAVAAGGTQYFVSSNAVFDDVDGDSSELVVWGLTNTSSLNKRSPHVSLTRKVIASQRYAVPPSAVQKDGPRPLGECIADTSGLIGGTNCGEAVLGVAATPSPAPILDGSDSRVLDVKFADGKLWAVLGTAAEVAGEQQAAVAWFVLDPGARTATGVRATMRHQGILAAEGESLLYPTIGVTVAGRGAIGFTRVGPELFPSYGYTAVTAAGTGPVAMAAEAVAPQDGFTGYAAFTDRPRWGDYGAAAVSGSTVYLAGQYIAQGECTLEQALSDGFSCGGKRTTLANWSTRVTALRP